jgi:excisionase family DNA binding protein
MTLVEKIASHRGALKVKELADLLGCSKGKLYKMIKTERIPHLGIGTMLRFDPHVISLWVQGKST